MARLDEIAAKLVDVFMKYASNDGKKCRLNQNELERLSDEEIKDPDNKTAMDTQEEETGAGIKFTKFASLVVSAAKANAKKKKGEKGEGKEGMGGLDQIIAGLEEIIRKYAKDEGKKWELSQEEFDAMLDAEIQDAAVKDMLKEEYEEGINVFNVCNRASKCTFRQRRGKGKKEKKGKKGKKGKGKKQEGEEDE